MRCMKGAAPEECNVGDVWNCGLEIKFKDEIKVSLRLSKDHGFWSPPSYDIQLSILILTGYPCAEFGFEVIISFIEDLSG